MSSTPKPPEIIPYLFYRDVGAALDFLCRAFGFKEEMRVGMHGQAPLQGRLVMMGQAAHERSMQSPRDASRATTGVFIYLDEVDKHFEVAKAAGAESSIRRKTSNTAGLNGQTISRDIHGFFTTLSKPG